MNTDPLKDLTPEKVGHLEMLANTSEQFFSHELEFREFCYTNRHLIIAALHAALRWRNEMDKTTRDEPYDARAHQSAYP